uniref:Uncharacterized protein n=1 Tax=Anopheles farauti TaxID=69004 RepID=A0A182QC61_9DIPT
MIIFGTFRTSGTRYRISTIIGFLSHIFRFVDDFTIIRLRIRRTTILQRGSIAEACTRTVILVLHATVIIVILIVAVFLLTVIPMMLGRGVPVALEVDARLLLHLTRGDGVQIDTQYLRNVRVRYVGLTQRLSQEGRVTSRVGYTRIFDCAHEQMRHYRQQFLFGIDRILGREGKVQ